MAVTEVGTLHLPSSDTFCGLALDIGGSVTKVIYRKKCSSSGGSKAKGSEAELHLVLVARTETDNELVKFIREECDVRASADDQPINVPCAGVGGAKLRKRFLGELRIRLSDYVEFDCFNKALQYMIANCDDSNTFDTLDPEGQTEGQRRVFEMVQAFIKVAKFSKMGRGGPPPGVGGPPPGVGGPPQGMGGPPPGVGGPPPVVGGPPPGVGGPPPGVGGPPSDVGGPPPDMSGPPPGALAGMSHHDPPSPKFPCLLAIFGSGICVLKIDDKGHFSVIDGCTSGGKMFLGLGNILTGSNKRNFDDLIHLASSGDACAVDTFGSDLKRDVAAEESIMAMPDSLLWTFGKTVDCKIPPREEDMLASLLNLICCQAITICHLAAKANHVQRVYLCGSFLNSQLVRKLVTISIVMRMAKDRDSRERIDFRFVKNGAFLGAIGAFLHQSDP